MEGNNLLINERRRNIFVKELYELLDARMKNVIYDGEQLSLGKGICFTVSKIAVKILRKLGYDCYVQRISYIIGNEGGKKKFMQFLKDGKIPKYENKEWVIGMGYSDEKVNENHYVVYFKSENLILDLTIKQATREDKGIIFKPFFTSLDKLPKEIISYKFNKPNKEYELSTSFYLSKSRKYYDLIIKEIYKNLKRWKK